MKAEKKRDPLKENLLFLLELVAVVLVALLLRQYVFTLTIVSGSSMEETLTDHEIVAVSKIDYAFSAPKRGDVVICHYPNSNKNFIKRVVAIAGDTIQIADGRTYLNGTLVDEPHITYAASRDFGPVTIEEGRVFVMGDNRANSHDSRAEGALEISMLEGRVLAVVYPFEASKWVDRAAYATEGS